MVKRCKWCDGTGVNLKAFVGQPCFTCKGTGGEWERVKELIGEEVVE
jgi:DnaJ-class molecular chaperone